MSARNSLNTSHETHLCIETFQDYQKLLEKGGFDAVAFGNDDD
jgi:hypothetical protein